jgi:hypothetical protein
MSTSEKSKGGQKPWTTDEQKTWLTAQLPAYVASRGTESPSDFWAGVFETWFDKWPIHGIEDGEGLSVQEQGKKKKVVSEIERLKVHVLTVFVALASQRLVQEP